MRQGIKKLLLRFGREVSPRKQLEPSAKEADNPSYGLETSNSELAPIDAQATTRNSPPATTASSRDEHGIRGRAGGREGTRSGTRTPESATRYIETSLGILSYAELAPYLANRVLAVHDDIVLERHAHRKLDDEFIRYLHQLIAGDLTPQIAGSWRKHDVVVGQHNPPPFIHVPVLIREYCHDLNARLTTLSDEPDEKLLETLAFAEGRLLSIHAFADFNGRVTRVFLVELTRRLQLPAINPTPDPGEPTAHYIAGQRMNPIPISGCGFTR